VRTTAAVTVALPAFVGALADAPASARLDTSDPAESIATAAAIVTRLLHIALLLVQAQLAFPLAGFNQHAL
jgi:hypothetical protein